MDLSRFEDLLDRHGGTLEAWPAAAQREAAVLLEASAAARAALEAMRQVEAELRRAPGGAISHPTVPAVTTLAAVAMRHRQEGRALRVARRAGWATAAALLLALGLSLGHIGAPEHDDSPEHVMAQALDISGSSDVD